MKKLLLILLAASLLAGCKKEVQGPVGPQGEQGPVGQQGPQGEDGEDGGGNVFVETHTASTWQLSGTTYFNSFTWGAATYALQNGGFVFSYIKVGNAWIMMPYIINSPEGNYFTRVTLGYTDAGAITIYWSDDDNATPAYPGTRVFKLVAISSRAMQQGPEHVQQLLDKALKD